LTDAFFSEDKVSEIRDRASIAEVVSDYVTLKKTGKNHKGLCPFHSEKTPSFMVNEEKQIFHCFGCGAGGDVFTFLMKAGHFSFPQAVEELARRYGIPLPRRESSPMQKKEMAKRELLFQINQLASDYFHGLLTRRKEGQEGRTYLAQREITQPVVEEHRLGYAPDRWDGLVEYLREKKVSLELAWELGLIFPKKREGWYDAFRGRVIFPIIDLHQRVVGFGGRLLKEGQPKYLNSPESALYHKGEILYGLPVARQHASEKDAILIVEGYFDLLTLHQFSLKNSVATLGTALTAQHLRVLKRYTKNVITVFDADQAGLQATLRALPLFLEEGVTGKTMTLPSGEDPDGFLRKGHLEEFRREMEGATPLIDFFFDRLLKRHDVRSIDGKVKAAEEGMGVIGKIPEKIRRDYYLNALADRLDLQASLLYEMLQTPKKRRSETEEDRNKGTGKESLPSAEETVVRLMIHHPEIIPRVSREGILEEFESPLLQGLAGSLVGTYQKKGRLDLTEAMGSLEAGHQEKLRGFAFDERGFSGGQEEKILKDCIEKIRGRRFKKDERDLLKRIREAERQREGERLKALLLERQALARRDRGLLKNSP